MKRVAVLRAKSDDELKNEIREINNSLMRLKSFIHRGGTPKNYAVIKSMRKRKARILTILSERKRARETEK